MCARVQGHVSESSHIHTVWNLTELLTVTSSPFVSLTQTDELTGFKKDLFLQTRNISTLYPLYCNECTISPGMCICDKYIISSSQTETLVMDIGEGHELWT